MTEMWCWKDQWEHVEKPYDSIQSLGVPFHEYRTAEDNS